MYSKRIIYVSFPRAVNGVGALLSSHQAETGLVLDFGMCWRNSGEEPCLSGQERNLRSVSSRATPNKSASILHLVYMGWFCPKHNALSCFLCLYTMHFILFFALDIIHLAKYRYSCNINLRASDCLEGMLIPYCRSQASAPSTSPRYHHRQSVEP